jgi:hypothetical protein
MLTEDIGQIADSGAPWLPDRLIPAREWYVPEVSPALATGEVGHQKLAAPDLAVQSVRWEADLSITSTRRGGSGKLS